MANRTKEERLSSLYARHDRLFEKRRSADHRRALATENYRAGKEAQRLADLNMPPLGYNPKTLRENWEIMQSASSEINQLDQKMSELRQRIEDVKNGIA